MTSPELSPLGKPVGYGADYDPSLLFPIARAQQRAALGLSEELPFVGVDFWNAYEFVLMPVASSNTAIIENREGEVIDDLPIEIGHYGPPRPDFLAVDDEKRADEVLVSHLFKSNCPVTGQPDWASLQIRYAGPRIARDGLLRYLVSFRGHSDFHEQCVERIFMDLMQRCAPSRLAVYARYTRRGGLDINPFRATPGLPLPGNPRTARQ
jgi:7-cyano-7-deazaguanine reductase